MVASVFNLSDSSAAANEGAEGTKNIAQKSMIVVENADKVMKQADISMESSDILIKLVGKFKL